MSAATGKILVRGGRVYDHDGDIHDPPVADILIEGETIAAVGPGLDAAGAEVVEAAGHLAIPGLVNAHYHSHDVLCRGLFEELPLETWMLYVPPMTAGRGKAEIRARTLVGALESLRAGITTVQDMVSLAPADEATADVVLDAYAEAGIRCVQAFALQDVAPVESVLWLGDVLPPDIQTIYGDGAPPADAQLAFAEAQIRRRPAGGRLHWALGPSAPQRCSPALLEGVAALAARHALPVYTHVYETRGQALMARERFAAHGGSLIRYLADCGLLGPRLTIAHSVWIDRDEMARLAAAEAGVVLNHLSNLKLKSGIAPVADLAAAGVRLALGCDNCSGSDVQNLFQAMKLYCLFHAVSDARPGPGRAAEALRLATEGGARSAGLDGVIGAIRPGMKADLALLDLADIGFVPFNSAARQLVYTETGRSVRTVIVDGRVVMRDGQILTVDEAVLRAEVADLMKGFRADFAAVRRERDRALPYLAAAQRCVWSSDLPLKRFLARTE